MLCSMIVCSVSLLFLHTGHAICALHVDGAVPIYKATIIPRGSALGMVTQLPEDDMLSLTRQQMLARLVVAMGGRAAEERIFGHDQVTSGASSDVENATRLARAMVTKYAMSDKVRVYGVVSCFGFDAYCCVAGGTHQHHG